MNLDTLTSKEYKAAIRYLKEQNKHLPQTLQMIPQQEWPIASRTPRQFEVWRSRYFLATVHRETGGVLRVSINRTELDEHTRRWRDGITWEELMQIKREIGRGELFAVEIFPADYHIVNVANMRHLWILPEAPDYAWFKGGSI